MNALIKRTMLILIFLVFLPSCPFFGNGDDNDSDMEKQYWGAQLRSKINFKHGRFSVRMRAPRKSGVISSYFTYYCVDPQNDCTKAEEIDIEFVGDKPGTSLQINYHHPTETSKSQHAVDCELNFDSQNEFATYSFEWTLEYLAWYVNDVQCNRRDTNTDPWITELDNNEWLMMNIWAGDWAGVITSDGLPVCAEYDWVKYYSWSPSEGFSNVPVWEDDFSGDGLDKDKWAVSNNETFEDSKADFVSQNAIVRNGYLYLYLTKKNQAPPDESVPVDGLVAYFPFNGNANDGLGQGHDGVVYGPVLTSDRFNSTDRAYLFDGVNDYILVSNSSGMNYPNISVSAWVKLSRLVNNTQARIMCKQVTSGGIESWGMEVFGNNYSGSSNANKFTFHSANCSVNGNLVSQTSLVAGYWYNVVGVNDGAYLKLYINGILDATIQSTGNTCSVNTASILMGRTSPKSDFFFPGAIDDIRIYNRVLTEDEIDALYHEWGW